MENRPLKGLYKLDRNCMALNIIIKRYHIDENSILVFACIYRYCIAFIRDRPQVHLLRIVGDIIF